MPRKLIAYLFMMLISACAVGPDFQRPDAPNVNGYTTGPLAKKTASSDAEGGAAQHFTENSDIPNQWWTLFQSPALNTLIEESLKANPDLDAAKAALKVAEENVKAQQGAYFPSMQADFTPTRQKIGKSVSGSSPLPNQQTLFSLTTAQVSVSYIPDVFGLNRRTVESLQAEADSQRFQLEAAYLTLTSNVVAAAVQEASLRAQIKATHELIDINTKMLEILRRQLATGYAAKLEVAAAEAQLAQVKGTLPPLEKQLAAQRNLLTALAGHFPSEGRPEKFELADLHLPEELPVSLPSKLVEQRPDIRAAEEQLHSASAEIGVATANMLPQFNLTAAAGDVGTSMAHLFNSTDSFWNLAAGVTQPIFQGGTLLHKKRAAEAAYDQAAAQYRSTVISAFQNVADTLQALQSDADGLKAAVESEKAAKTSLDLTREQMKVGYVNYLTLLNAEQAYQQAIINLAQAEASRFADTAALFQALGGGWWNRDEIENKKASL